MPRVPRAFRMPPARGRLLSTMEGASSDLYDLRQVLEALRASEDKYRTLFDSIDAGFCTIEVLFDAGGRAFDYRFLETNPAFLRQTGLENAIGRTVLEMAPEHEPFWFETYGRIARSGEAMRFEHAAAALGRFYDVYAFPIGEPGGHRVAILFNDIFPRKQAEAARQRSEERFRLFLKASTDILFRMSADWSEMRSLEGKSAIANGRDPGRHWLEQYVPESDRALLEESIAAAIHSKCTFELEHRIVRADASVGWAFSRAIPLLDEKGEILEWFGAASDISERKRSAERQEFLMRLADTLRPLADAIEVQDQATRMLSEYLEVAHVYYYDIRLDEDELQVGRGYSAGGATWPQRNRLSDYGDLVVNAFRRGETVAVDDVEQDPLLNESIRETFRAIGARASVGVPLVKDGRLAGSLGLHQPTARQWTMEELQLIEEVAERTWEAVERARAEAALREREEKYRSLFDAIDEGFNLIEVLFGDDGRPYDCRILEVNPAYQRNTGLPPSVVGLRLREFIPDFEQRIIDTYGEVARSGRAIRFEEYVGGLDRWFDCYAFRVGGEGSRQVAVVFNNVTEKRRAADQLREADRRKSEFLAMLGHELRNPLAAVEGGLKLLQSPRSLPESREATLPIVAQQVAHMKRLIDDVLDLARLDRGKLQVKRVAVDLDTTLRASIQMTESLAQAKSSPIRYIPPPSPLGLFADPERLVQVFANLLTNALKFSPPCSPVEIRAVRRDGHVVVEVRDYGQGIAPENLGEIFEPFVQSKLSLGLPEGGLGLGLSVSRELVELHGGSISAHSAGLEKGSTFTVSLPLSGDV